MYKSKPCKQCGETIEKVFANTKYCKECSRKIKIEATQRWRCKRDGLEYKAPIEEEIEPINPYYLVRGDISGDHVFGVTNHG